MCTQKPRSTTRPTIVKQGTVERLTHAQAQLMEEGSISVDPDSENPAADFYANSEAADIGDDQEVEDAGPGNHLDGWIHPELLDPPSPEEVASFVDPATQNAAPVLNPVDYQRNPGAALAMGSARRNIKKIRSELTKTHEEAQAAKATYEAEEAKTQRLKTEYAKMQQQQQAMMRARSAGAHNWSPDMDTAAARSGNLMWSRNAEAPRHENNAVDPNTWKVDTDNMDDPAAEFRNNFYNRQQEEQAFLARMAQQQQQALHLHMRYGPRAESPLMAREQGGGNKMAQEHPARRTAWGQQLRILNAPGAAEDGRAAADARLAKEAYRMRVHNEEVKLKSDMLRLQMAKARLAQRQRTMPQGVAARSLWAKGEGIVENCPEGTPGCRPSTRSARGLGRRNAGLSERNTHERFMETIGDDAVPVEEARVQRPRFELMDSLYQ